jgi:two-component sensor histidine kinase
MDRLLLLLPGPQPAWLRYAATTAIVTAFFAIQVSVSVFSGFAALFLILPGVFLASIIFNHGSGFYASFLATALVSWLFMPDLIALSRTSLPLVLFFLTGLGVAAISEALRKALEHFRDAERANDLLLREMAHRTKNNLAMVCSLLRIQARASNDGHLRDALMAAVARVQVMADVNDFLHESHRGRTVDINTYLEELCQKLADALRDTRPVAIRVVAQAIELPAEKAVPIGIIVNELVTNSFKHAFPDGRPGVVTVNLRQDGDTIVSVEDNGVGCDDTVVEGLGGRLVQLMTQQLHGVLGREPVTEGCKITLRMKS